VGAVATTSKTTIKLRWGKEGGWPPLVRILLDDDASCVIVVVVVAIRGISDGIARRRDPSTVRGQCPVGRGVSRLAHSNRRVGRMTGMEAK